MRMHPLLRVMALHAACCFAGCSQTPPPLRAPTIPDDAGEQAVGQYDQDGDGAVGGAELDAVPSLKSALKRADQDGDDKLTAAEIKGRVEVWRKSQIGVWPVLVTVQQNGQPLPEALVTLEPESFLGEAVKTASGTTNSRGTAVVRISTDPDERGVHLGFYRIKVSRPAGDGRETIPARYNAETALGAEVASDDPSLEHIRLNLTGR